MNVPRGDRAQILVDRNEFCLIRYADFSRNGSLFSTPYNLAQTCLLRAVRRQQN